MDFDTASQLSEEQARDYLEQLRWPDGVLCPHCNSPEVTKLNGKAHRAGVWKCKDCRKQFTVTIGTIFERSHISLRKWIMAFHIVCASKKGVSALQLQRMLGLKSYKSAWHLAHRIRHAMQNGPIKGMLAGTIEVDETFVGGKPRGMSITRNVKQRGWATPKIPVMALIQRDGEMRTRVVPRVTTENLRAAIDDMVDKSRSRLMTDAYHAYRPVGREFAGGHKYVRHGMGEYARGDAHCNTCESFFALLKRGLMGSFHHVSREHLQRYADEFAFRWNHRKITDEERTEAALRLAPGCRLMYNSPVDQ